MIDRGIRYVQKCLDTNLCKLSISHRLQNNIWAGRTFQISLSWANSPWHAKNFRGNSENPVIGSIALKGGPFIEKVKRRKDISLIEVTEKNRDELVHLPPF